eukprot:14560484-Heterocapsa_arctica.AAC.1
MVEAWTTSRATRAFHSPGWSPIRARHGAKSARGSGRALSLCGRNSQRATRSTSTIFAQGSASPRGDRNWTRAMREGGALRIRRAR